MEFLPFQATSIFLASTVLTSWHVAIATILHPAFPLGRVIIVCSSLTDLTCQARNNQTSITNPTSGHSMSISYLSTLSGWG